MKRLPVFLLTSLLSLPLAANPLGFALPQNLPMMAQHIPTVINRIDGDIYELTGGQGTAHIFAGGQRIASKTGDTALYFHQDHLGSTSLITNSVGAVVQTTKYLPFGATWSTSGSLTDINFTGHRLDTSDGLICMKARYYDPGMGRFITPNTIIASPYNPQTLNRYAYCDNNPINFIDPLGNWKLRNFLKSTVQVTAIVAAVAMGPGAGFMAYAALGGITAAATTALTSGANIGDAMKAGAIGFAAGAAGGAMSAGISVAVGSGASNFFGAGVGKGVEINRF